MKKTIDSNQLELGGNIPTIPTSTNINYEVKLFEIRVRATTIPMIGIKFKPSYDEEDVESFLIRHAGYGHSNEMILFGMLRGGGFEYNPESWGSLSRTKIISHEYISKHWDDLKSGTLIDVEYILGETLVPKQSEFIKFNGIVV